MDHKSAVFLFGIDLNQPGKFHKKREPVEVSENLKNCRIIIITIVIITEEFHRFAAWTTL